MYELIIIIIKIFIYFFFYLVEFNEGKTFVFVYRRQF